MPSDRQQLNVRLDPKSSALWAVLVPKVKEALRLDLSQPQVIALALQALADKYGVSVEEEAPASAPRTSARKRSG